MKRKAEGIEQRKQQLIPGSLKVQRGQAHEQQLTGSDIIQQSR